MRNRGGSETQGDREPPTPVAPGLEAVKTECTLEICLLKGCGAMKRYDWHRNKYKAKLLDLSGMETWRHGDMETRRHGDMETWRHGDMETWRHGDMETWRHGDMDSWSPRSICVI